MNANFDLDLTEADVAGAFAGLRPLIASQRGATADLSRRHAVYDIAPGITGITGGKLTTYRRMAKDAVDHVAAELGVTSKSRTRWIRLGARDVGALSAAVQRRCRVLDLPHEASAGLVRRYGDRALDVLEVAHAEDLTRPMVEGHDAIAAEAAYNVRAEMAAHLNDLLMRRTRIGLIDPEAGVGSDAVASRVMADELGWSERELQRQVDSHRSDVERERGLPLGPIRHRPSVASGLGAG